MKAAVLEVFEKPLVIHPNWPDPECGGVDASEEVIAPAATYANQVERKRTECESTMSQTAPNGESNIQVNVGLDCEHDRSCA
jgi:hypothetical protein